MSIIERFLRFCLGGLFSCRHTHTYRERRMMYGVPVMHLVCERCGHAAPAMQRTPSEHLHAVTIGGERNTRVYREPSPAVNELGPVVHIDTRRRPQRPRPRRAS